mgnify:CR=1 FL=1
MTALACVAAAFTAFPITNISPDASQFAALNGSNATLRDRTANDLVGSALRSWFSVPANMVEIKKSDLNLKGTYPNTVVDGSCGHHMEADGNNYDVTLKKDSFLNGSLHVNLTDGSAAVFAEGYLDANLNVKSTVHVSTGAKFFGHGCTRIASTHTTISVGADGKTLLASKLALTKVHVGMANGSLALIGNLNFTIDGKEIDWDVAAVTASGNCKIEVLGITLVSICGWLAGEIKSHLQPMVKQITQVTAPAVLERIQDKVQAKIGEQLVIPIKL